MSGRGVGNYDTRGTSRASQAVHRDRMMERLEDALDALDEARKELGLSLGYTSRRVEEAARDVVSAHRSLEPRFEKEPLVVLVAREAGWWQNADSFCAALGDEGTWRMAEGDELTDKGFRVLLDGLLEKGWGLAKQSERNYRMIEEWRDNQSYVVPRPAVLEAPIVEVLRKHLHENKSEERVLALLAIEYLTAHPELLAEQLVKHVIEWATQKTDNWNRPSDGRVAVREAAHESLP